MKKLTALLLAALMVLALLTACGGSDKSSAAGNLAMQAAPREEMALEAPAAMDSNAALSESGSGKGAALPENRKWIVTVNLDAETEDLDALLGQLDEKVASLSGYMEDQEIYNGSGYSTYRHRNARLTIRVPAKDVDAFTEAVAGIANVVSKNVSREDITLAYSDTESKLTALRTEETRLLELLAKAETMADLLEIEARLSEVRYELERYASRLRLYDNQVDFATIYLFVDEVKEYTPVAEKTVWERIRDGFGSSLKGLWESIVDLFVWVIVSSPYLLVYGCVLGAILIGVRKSRANRKKKTGTPPMEEKTE